MTRALIFVGGELGDVVSSDLPAADMVIAADSGLTHAIALGMRVNLLVGDLDSVDPTLIGATAVERHPADKDATDTELAVLRAIANGATDVVVVGGVGGRLDHWLAIIFGLCRDEWASIRITAYMGRSRAYVVRDAIDIEGEVGQTISQFAVNGTVTGLMIAGLKWAGRYEQLDFGSSLGVSNVFVERHCHLSVETGVMLVVHELGPR